MQMMIVLSGYLGFLISGGLNNKMSNLNEEVIQAIHEAVSAAGQPDQVTNRIKAWLNAMATSEVSSSDEQEYLETVFDAIMTGSLGDSDED